MVVRATVVLTCLLPAGLAAGCGSSKHSAATAAILAVVAFLSMLPHPHVNGPDLHLPNVVPARPASDES